MRTVYMYNCNTTYVINTFNIIIVLLYKQVRNILYENCAIIVQIFDIDTVDTTPIITL